MNQQRRAFRRKRAAQAVQADQANAEPMPHLVWGIANEVRENRAGRLHRDQISRIKRISIFDPWLRLAFGAFLIVFAATQRPESWQFWLPLAVAVYPIVSAVSGIRAMRRLRHATVEVIEGTIDEVRPHRSEGVAATLHRERLFMFLLNYTGSSSLPKPDVPYRFYVVFGVLRPGIVVAVEERQGTNDER